jgi:hypothetical protein
VLGHLGEGGFFDFEVGLGGELFAHGCSLVKIGVAASVMLIVALPSLRAKRGDP